MENEALTMKSLNSTKYCSCFINYYKGLVAIQDIIAKEVNLEICNSDWHELQVGLTEISTVGSYVNTKFA